MNLAKSEAPSSRGRRPDDASAGAACPHCAEQQAAQPALDQRLAESQGLLEMSTLLQTADDLGNVLDRIVEGTVRFVGAEFGGIGLPDGDGVVFERVLVDGNWRSPRTCLRMDTSTVAASVLRTGTVVVVPDTAQAGRFDLSFVRQAGVHSFALAPVTGQGGIVVALLGVGSREGGQVYGAQQATLLEAAARHAGAAIERVRIQQERDRLHRDAVRRAREMEILVDATAALHAADDPESIVRVVGAHAADLCGASIVSVGLRQGNDLMIDRLRLDGTWCRIEYPWTADTSIIGRVIDSGRPYRSDDLAADPHSDHESDARHGFRTQLSVPLLGTDGEALGVVTLYNKAGGPFTAEDETLIGTLAAQGALALERVRSREALAESLTALARSEERFRSLAQNVSDVITLIGDDGTVRYQSPAIEAVLGYQPSELVGANILPLVHPDDRPAVVAMDKAVRAGRERQPPLEVRFRHKDGSWRYLEVVASNLLDDPAVRAVVVNSRDVTERRAAEETKRFLSEASARLVTSLASGDTIAGVAELAIPVLGDWCVAHILAEDGRIEPAAVAAADPAVASLYRELGGRRRFAVTSDDPVAEAIRTGTPRLVDPTAEAPIRSARKRAHVRLLEALGTTSWMAVPLTGRRARLGALSFGLTGTGRRYGAEDVALAEELARRVALAVENAQLYHELAERKRQLEDLVARLLSAHEEERRRVAYEVHDGVAQVAASAHQHLQAYGARHRPRRPEARRELDRAIALAQQTVQEARRVVAGLRPTVLDDFGLATALRHEVEALRADGWDVAYDQELGAERLPASVETALFRVAQEAIVNARKHSRGTRLAVGLHRGPDAVRLEVRDWGAGFDPSAPAPAPPGERVGIAGMQERVTLLGGTFHLDSRPGHGTRLVADVPLSDRAAR
jgi:PAS domain S-box-containing protein